jgi:hydrogenase-4 component F
MTALGLTLLFPAIGVLLFGLIGHWRSAGFINIGISAATFISALVLAFDVFEHGVFLAFNKLLIVDPFNVYLILLTAFVGLTTAIFSGPYMEHERHIGRIDDKRMKLYHSMFQGFLFTMLLALSANNLGILWVAIEAATLTTVLLVSLYRTHEAIEAGWKYFILCGVGISQALFGTILIYSSAAKVVPGHEDGLLWSVLREHATNLDPGVLALAFVFLLVGYGTKVGLVPLHNWLPDAHSEGPTPISAILSGLLLNVALYALVRFKMLVDPALGNHLAGNLMMGFGMLSFIVAGILLHRQYDIKRMFSYSSIEHMGLMTFAFGVGGPLATFGGLLHMIAHSLAKSSIFVTVGQASRIAGTQLMGRIRGLIRCQPTVGWGLLLGVCAIAGFPPFGIFTSELLLFLATMKSYPWMVVPLLLGLSIAFAGLFRNIQPMVFGEPPEDQKPLAVNMWPVFIHLALVLWLGLAIPTVLVQWLDQATIMIVGRGVL